MSTSLSPRSTAVHPTRQQLDELDALLQRMLDLPVNQVEEPEGPDEAVPEPPVSYKIPIAEPSPRLEPRIVLPKESVQSPPLPAAPPPAPAVLRPAPAQMQMPAPPEFREPGPDDWVRLASTWQPSAQTWQPLAQSWQQAARPAERPVVPPAAAVPPPAPVAPPPPARAMEPEEPPPHHFAPVPTTPAAEALAEDLFVPLSAPRTEVKSTPQSPAPAGSGYAVWQWPLLPVNAAFDLLTLPLGPLGAGLRTRAGRYLLAALGIGCLAAAAALVAADEFGWIW
jgi:hypothetical protein